MLTVASYTSRTLVLAVVLAPLVAGALPERRCGVGAAVLGSRLLAAAVVALALL